MKTLLLLAVATGVTGLQHDLPARTGDLDTLLERREIRVLVPYSRTLFFNDKGAQRGLTADTLRDFEIFLNRKYPKKGYPITVVALPTTITGSIGSFTGKLNLHGLYNKLGLTRDFVTRGSFPFLESDYHDWTAAEESLITRQQWEDYDRWIKDIAASRKLAPGMVDQLGRGRVWTGQQAHENGLVDELGGESTAIQVAQELAGIPESVRPRIVHYPEEKNFLQVLLEEDGDLVWAGAVEHWAHSMHIPRMSTWSVLDLHFLP